MEGYTGIQINPREYQKESLRGIWRAWGKHDKVLLVLPTGCGKTMVFSMLINHLVKNENKKVLILAHRGVLLEQARDKLLTSTGIDSALEKADESGVGTFHNVVVASIQSLSKKKRLANYHKDSFDYIIVDETHRVIAKTYQRIIGHFNSAQVLGVTATAYRGDKKSLARFFDVIAYEYRMSKAIKDGWLSPIVAEVCPVTIDLRNCTVTAGDYRKADIDTSLEPHLKAIAREIKKKAPDRKILLFLPLVATSRAMAEILTAEGIECRSVDGSMSDEAKKESLEWFRDSGRGTALCNAMLLTEGYDQADIDCIVVLRATKSTGLYTQMVGRGTRVLSPEINTPNLTAEDRKKIIAESEKKNLLLLDFLWLTSKHRLCTPTTLADISVEDQDVAYAHREDRVGKQFTVEELEEVIRTEKQEAFRKEREGKLADYIEAMSGRKSMRVNPVLQALSLFDDSLVDWEPTTDKEKEVKYAGSGDKEYLKLMGISDCDLWCDGFVQKTLGIIKDRRARGLCTPRQLKLLLKYGVRDAHNKTFESASAIISSISKNWNRRKR